MELVALKWCGNWANALVFSLPVACECPPTTVVILHAETGFSSYVYSDLVGYQTTDIRLLWTIITKP